MKKIQALVLAVMMLVVIFVPITEANAASGSITSGFVGSNAWSWMYYSNQWSTVKDINFSSPPASATLRSVGVNSITNTVGTFSMSNLRMQIRSKQTGVVLNAQVDQYITGYFGGDATQTFEFRSGIENSSGAVQYINCAIAPLFTLYWDS
jgi:hypothetical protein